MLALLGRSAGLVSGEHQAEYNGVCIRVGTMGPQARGTYRRTNPHPWVCPPAAV